MNTNDRPLFHKFENKLWDQLYDKVKRNVEVKIRRALNNPFYYELRKNIKEQIWIDFH